MSKCSKCGTELDDGAKFCMECGTPVPQVKKCVQCGMELPLKAKFCFSCGAPQAGCVAGSGISMGNKNVIAGDVIGQKVAGDNVQNKIMGNAIYNTIQDETKRVNRCHVCGKHLTNDNGHTCPGCGNVVCDEHFDARKNLCLKCVDAKKQNAIKQYESALLSIGANGRIGVIERNKLDVLANSLGLSKEDVLPLEQKFKLQVNVSALTRIERMTLETVQKSYFEGKLEDSFENIKKLFERYPNDEEVVNWYLRLARVLEPDETIDIIAKLQSEFCESYFSLACIYLAKNQVSDAEVALNKARKMWPDVISAKCIEVLLLFKLFKTTAKSEFLREADGILQGIGSLLDNYESFLVKNERILLEYLQGNKSNWKNFDIRFLDLIGLGLPIAMNQKQLGRLIEDAIEVNGLECDLNFIDVSNVTDMSYLFMKVPVGFSEISEEQMTRAEKRLWLRHLFNGDISQWDVSNVKRMYGMFMDSQFNGDISKWNVSNVTGMTSVFAFSEFNGDISQWDVSNVKSMASMFSQSQFNGDISQWNVSNVTDMSLMFLASEFNGDISQWNVSNVTDMSLMFLASEFNGDISQWDVSNVKRMYGMFMDSQFNGDISKWNVSNVTDVSYMFGSLSTEDDKDYRNPFNGDISQWDVSNVTNMQAMFKYSAFNGNISKWNVSNVTNMQAMFKCSEFNGDISQWDVSNVTDMKAMFKCSKFNGDISQWDVSNVTNMNAMFVGSKFNGDIGRWEVSYVTDMAWMFRESEFNGDISQWDVSNVTNMQLMFKSSKFKGNISQWDVSNVTNMCCMFDDSALKKKENSLIGMMKNCGDLLSSDVGESLAYSCLRNVKCMSIAKG